jgi:hypothetical protein
MPNQIVIFGLAIVLIVIVLVLAHLAAKKRREELEAFARSMGFTFAPDDDEAALVHAQYDGFEPFGRGRGQTSYNLITGARKDLRFEMFDYKYTTGSGKNKRTHRCGIVAAHVPVWFKKLRLRPEGFFDKMAAFAGFDDINFESHEFSARYHVACDDRQYAYQLIHPQAIEFLLRCPALHWQFNGPVVVIHKRGRFKPDELRHVVEAVEGFVKLVPAFVREDQAHLGAPGLG